MGCACRGRVCSFWRFFFETAEVNTSGWQVLWLGLHVMCSLAALWLEERCIMVGRTIQVLSDVGADPTCSTRGAGAALISRSPRQLKPHSGADLQPCRTLSGAVGMGW